MWRFRRFSKIFKKIFKDFEGHLKAFWACLGPIYDMLKIESFRAILKTILKNFWRFWICGFKCFWKFSFKSFGFLNVSQGRLGPIYGILELRVLKVKNGYEKIRRYEYGV